MFGLHLQSILLVKFISLEARFGPVYAARVEIPASAPYLDADLFRRTSDSRFSGKTGTRRVLNTLEVRIRSLRGPLGSAGPPLA